MLITESTILPITSGTLEVDTSEGSIIIYMSSGNIGDVLEIIKISEDTNVISLFSETTLINDAEIVMFGVPSHANVKYGKIKSMILESDGKNWKIIKEE